MTTKNTLVLAALLLLVCNGVTATAQAITVSGQVVSDCLGPVSGMRVSFHAEGYGYRSVQTDADGRYSFIDVPASDVEAWISFPAPTGMQIVSPTSSTVYISIQTDQTIDVALICNVATIHGQLTSDCDGGLANIPVFLDLRDGSDPLSTTSDPDGFYSFTDVFSTNIMRMWIEAPDGYLVVSPYQGRAYIWPSSPDIQQDFQLLCPAKVIYFEDFNADDHGWTAIDNTYQTDNAGPRESYWHRYSYNDAGDARGVYWCGLDASDPCAGLTMPGYGSKWDERLVRSLALPASSTMTIVHKFDTERNYDYCYLQISVDGGATYATLATYTGDSWGFITSNIVLVGYEGDVDFRFRFTSDGGYDDEDGDYDSDGAWLIDSIALNSVVIADFESGDDGWVAQPLGGPALAGFRLEADPPCDPAGTCYANMGCSWVAYDPVTGLVPLSTEDQTIRLALESPEIELPNEYQTVSIDFCRYMNGMRVNEARYISFEIISTHPNTGCPEVEDYHMWYYSGGLGGWFSTSHEIGSYIQPGATSFRVRLLYGDWSICPNSMGFPCGHGEGSSEAPYFDNFLVAVRGSSTLGIDLPYDLECPGSYATPSGPTTVSVSGNVTSGECMGTLADVPVDLVTAGGDFFTTMTDSEGNYLFEDVPESDDPGEISIVVPLGFVAVTPADGCMEIDLSEDQTVDFVLDCGSPSGPVRTIGYWKHQAKAYIDGRGHPHETQQDMWTNFPQTLFDRFHGRAQDAIAIDGVTYIDNGSGPEPITLETMRITLTVNNHGTMIDRAKQQYLAMLLNIVSGKLLTHTVVSIDGSTTASQALQEIADLILDGDDTNDEAAKEIADIINNGNPVPGEMIRDSWPEVLYSPPPPAVELQSDDLVLDPPRPNPCRPSTGIRFEMPQPGVATLRVYDSAGRVVRDLINGHRAAGEHLITWDGTDNAGSRLTSGVYFLRLETQGSQSTRRLILAN